MSGASEGIKNVASTVGKRGREGEGAGEGRVRRERGVGRRQEGGDGERMVEGGWRGWGRGMV